MARKSVASMSVAKVAKKDSRLPPPSSLTKEQRVMWLAITSSRPSDWFTVDAGIMLLAYIKASTLYEKFAVNVEKAVDNKKTTTLEMQNLLSMMNGQLKIIIDFGSKMRLTNQSRWQPDTASRKFKKTSGGITGKPWDQ
jgi:hypothetical protein